MIVYTDVINTLSTDLQNRSFNDRNVEYRWAELDGSATEP